MEKQRRFLTELYSNRIEKIPFIEYFQNDPYLRKALFNQIQAKGDFPITNGYTLKVLKEIHTEIEDFEKSALMPVLENITQNVQIFVTNIINKLDSIGIPKLKNRLLADFKENQENKNITANFVVDEILGLAGNITIETAQRNYRELKRISDVYITTYLTDQNRQQQEIMVKIKDIGKLDFKTVDKKIALYDSVDKKLDHLKTQKERYYDRFQFLKESLTGRQYEFFIANHSSFWEYVFGNFELLTPLSIQSPVFRKHFSDPLNNPVFTYWFLKYNAEQLFNRFISSVSFQNKIQSNLSIRYINAELKELQLKEAKAFELLHNKELDIYAYHKNNYRYSDELELLRILDGNYYKYNTVPTISSLGGPEVQAYFKHLLLKPYLQELLEKVSLNDEHNKELKPAGSIPDAAVKKEFIFKNNFDSNSEAEVYRYFYENLVARKFMIKESLHEYLIQAFENKKLSSSKFSISNKPVDTVIRKIFYDYYKVLAGKPYGKQFNYVRLLGDYFAGFDSDSLKTNFSKTY